VCKFTVMFVCAADVVEEGTPADARSKVVSEQEDNCAWTVGEDIGIRFTDFTERERSRNIVYEKR
jgi:hypothetical protein